MNNVAVGKYIIITGHRLYKRQDSLCNSNRRHKGRLYKFFLSQYNWLVYRYSYSLSQYFVSVDDTLFLVSAISTILPSTNNNNINAHGER